MNFASLNCVFLFLFDLRDDFEVVNTGSVVILVGTGKKLFEGFSVLISCGLVFFLLNFFFLLNTLPELFSFNSLKSLKLLGGFSSLFGEPLLEGLFLFFLMESFHGFGESESSVFIELDFASFFFLLFYKNLFLFKGG